MKTHHNFEYAGVTEALPSIMAMILADGEEVGTRQGERSMEILMPRIALWKPWEREVLAAGRRASLPAQIAETMWVLAGRNDIEWLSHYLPRAGQFSDDDGKTWRGAYGPRLRKWFDRRGYTYTDQLVRVVNLLKNERGTRRAVMAIYDPSIDLVGGKDVPCNDFLTFISRQGKLHMTVTTRSNDVMWGWSGINQFEWSALLEIVAHLTGNVMGTLTFNITSLHLYEKHWAKAGVIVAEHEDTGVLGVYGEQSPRFDLTSVDRTVESLDSMIKRWFDIEHRLRHGSGTDAQVNRAVEDFPEPMFRSWLKVIQWYWTGHDEYLHGLEETRLGKAARLSPRGKNLLDTLKANEGKTVRIDDHTTAVVGPAVVGPAIPPSTEKNLIITLGPELRKFKDRMSTRDQVAPLIWYTSFINYVDQLHREKSAVYGDSWKKRGEQISILANIARKIDRLGVDGAGDSAADTVIDLLVYLIKYRLWINEQMWPENPGPEPENDAVRSVLESEDRACPKVVQRKSLALRFTGIKGAFQNLENIVSLYDKDLVWLKKRATTVDTMIRLAFPAARLLWAEENGHILKPEQAAELLVNGSLDEANATARRAVVNESRRWEGYEVGENID